MGLFDDIGEIIEDVADIPGDIVEAAASLFDGPGGVVGIFVSGTSFLVGGPAALVPAIITGVIVTEAINAVIKTRLLSPEERALAEMVFGNHLPPYDKIILTNLGHPQGRAFVVPNAAGESLVNLGDAYYDPIRHTSAAYPEHGQLLIHELTHTWQIHHSSFLPGLICEGIINQVRNEFEDGIYNPGNGQKAWSEYNAEQQAAIVDHWYCGWGSPCSRESHLYHHIKNTVNQGVDPPSVQPLSVRTVALKKFVARGSFSVRNQFPRHAPHDRHQLDNRSLRKVLIGLYGTMLKHT
jgi:hypothetical protein